MKSFGQVGYEAMLERMEQARPERMRRYEDTLDQRPAEISEEDWRKAFDYSVGKWEEQPQVLRDDWDAIGVAIENAVRSR